MLKAVFYYFNDLIYVCKYSHIIMIVRIMSAASILIKLHLVKRDKNTLQCFSSLKPLATSQLLMFARLSWGWGIVTGPETTEQTLHGFSHFSSKKHLLISAS